MIKLLRQIRNVRGGMGRVGEHLRQLSFQPSPACWGNVHRTMKDYYRVEICPGHRRNNKWQTEQWLFCRSGGIDAICCKSGNRTAKATGKSCPGFVKLCMWHDDGKQLRCAPHSNITSLGWTDFVGFKTVPISWVSFESKRTGYTALTYCLLLIKLSVTLKLHLY